MLLGVKEDTQKSMNQIREIPNPLRSTANKHEWTDVYRSIGCFGLLAGLGASLIFGYTLYESIQELRSILK